MSDWTDEVVGTCPVCGEGVRLNQRRVLTDDGLAHLSCSGREVEPEPEDYEAAKRIPEARLARQRAEVAMRLGEPDVAERWQQVALSKEPAT